MGVKGTFGATVPTNPCAVDRDVSCSGLYVASVEVAVENIHQRTVADWEGYAGSQLPSEIIGVPVRCERYPRRPNDMRHGHQKMVARDI
jgi:hypothetical protein